MKLHRGCNLIVVSTELYMLIDADLALMDAWWRLTDSVVVHDAVFGSSCLLSLTAVIDVLMLPCTQTVRCRTVNHGVLILIDDKLRSVQLL